MYGLPSTTDVDQVLPKKAFYEHLKLSGAVKDEFVQKIEELRVVASIKERSCGFAATDDVREILVLRVALKGDELPLGVLDAIAANNPNKLVFACAANGDVQFTVRRGGLQVGEREPEDMAKLVLSGSTLADAWDSLCSQVVFGDAGGIGVDTRIANQKRIAALKDDIAHLERAHAKEVQPAKRNALFKQIKAAKQEYAELGGK